MKNYEWSNKHTSVRRCSKCGEVLEFADMKCPNCGADARAEQRAYKPKLSSDEIQTAPRERVGGPQMPQGDYSEKSINRIKYLSMISAVTVAFGAGAVASAMSGKLWVGIVAEVILMLFLVLIARIITISLHNSAAAARNSERIALNIEYQINQMNEFITTYNRDKDIDAKNAEVFAKLLVKISNVGESQKNAIEELTAAVGEISAKLDDFDFEEFEEVDSLDEEPEIIEAAEEKAEESVADDVIEESTEEENKPEEKAEEPEETKEETEDAEEVKEEPTVKEEKKADKEINDDFFDESDEDEVVTEYEEDDEEEGSAFDARSAAAEDWDDGFFDKESPTSRLEAFLDDDED